MAIGKPVDSVLVDLFRSNLFGRWFKASSAVLKHTEESLVFGAFASVTARLTKDSHFVVVPSISPHVYVAVDVVKEKKMEEPDVRWIIVV